LRIIDAALMAAAPHGAARINVAQIFRNFACSIDGQEGPD